ncbi:MAG: CPBP family intramembrane metalloprotease [Gemmatimonadota bacterium]|nr:CPBP family intramembrane metalloprotease [Gemmatimonadota bacterium]MDH5759976.1 CPBP family intramembrane metalloprotease [Gemmatimonadota bacterium]
MKIRWPPHPLGLDAPLNIVLLGPGGRSRITPSMRLGAAVGLAVAFLIVLLDVLLFAGETVRRLPEFGTHPSIPSRLFIVVVGSVGEELFFRALVATLAAWLVYLALTPFTRNARTPARWAGILLAAGLAGMWHVGAPEHAVRVLTIGGISGVTYGWLYWWKGLEAAILAHMVVTASLYLAVPAIF